MPARHHDDGRLIDELLEYEALAVADRRPQQGHIDLPGLQPRDQERRVARRRKHNDIRIMRAVFADDRGDEWMKIGPAAGADIDPPGLAAAAGAAHRSWPARPAAG